MTQNSTFQPTLLQKLLGRNYKWWYVITYENKIQLAYIWNNIAWVFARIIIVFTSLLIWSLNPAINKSELFTYIIIGNILLEITEMAMPLRLGWEIRTGRISSHLMLPSSYGLLLFFRTVGRSIVGNLQSVGVLSIFGLFYLNNLQGTQFILYLIPFVLVSVFIKFIFSILLGFLAFWFIEIESFVEGYRALNILLSGSLLPLTSIPNIGHLLLFQPFAFTFYHPMQIYLGKYTDKETFYVFLGGITWCIVLYFLAKLVFKLGLKRNESVGL